jgi:hypothetical protein
MSEFCVVESAIPSIFCNAKCTTHEDAQAIGMASKHGEVEFCCTECFVFEYVGCRKSAKDQQERTYDFASAISRMRMAVGLPELSQGELLKIVTRTYTRVISEQDSLLKVGGAEAGACWTGFECYDSRLWKLYSMQSELEAILRQLPASFVSCEASLR